MHSNNVGRFVRLPELERVTGLSASTLARLERQGLFPKRLKLTSRAVGWRADEIGAWLEERRRVGANGQPADSASTAS